MMNRSVKRGENGSVMAATVVYMLVLMLVVGALLRLAASGSVAATTRTTTLRLQRSANAAATYLIEELTVKRLAPCTSTVEVAVPPTLSGAESTSATCAPLGDLDGHPLVMIEVTVAEPDSTVSVRVIAQVASDQYRVNVVEHRSL